MTPPMPSNQDGQTTCKTCGDPVDETHGLLSSPNSRYCPEPRGTGSVPSEPADNLEQEIRELWKTASLREDKRVEATLALIRRRERASYERGRIAEAKTCEETKQHDYTKVRMEAVEAFDPLHKYLAHYGTCSYIKKPLSDEPCTCGLDAELARLKEGKE